MEADLIKQTRTEVVSDLVEKYYRSAFDPESLSGSADSPSVDISERMELVFAAMGAVKGILNRGIRTLEVRLLHERGGARCPFGVNVILPNTEESNREAEELVADLDRKMRELAEKYHEERGSSPYSTPSSPTVDLP